MNILRKRIKIFKRKEIVRNGIGEVERVGRIKKDGKVMICSLDVLIWASVCDKELFDKFFILTPINKIVNMEECEVFGFIDMDKK